jgi:hypothetical protein
MGWCRRGGMTRKPYAAVAMERTTITHNHRSAVALSASRLHHPRASRVIPSRIIVSQGCETAPLCIVQQAEWVHQ